MSENVDATRLQLVSDRRLDGLRTSFADGLVGGYVVFEHFLRLLGEGESDIARHNLITDSHALHERTQLGHCLGEVDCSGARRVEIVESLHDKLGRVHCALLGFVASNPALLLKLCRKGKHL